jgi:hypothetical protein
MKFRNNCFAKLCLPAFLFTSIFVFSFLAAANPSMKWCTTWKAEYEDSGYGEDTFASTGANNRPARYTAYKLVNYTDSYVVNSGTLDIDGCTPYIAAESNKVYQFIQYTHAIRVNRQFIVLSDAVTGWNSTDSQAYYNYYMTGTLSEGQSNQHTFYPGYVTSKTNIMPIVGRILRYYSTYSMPSGHTIKMHTDADNCNDPAGGGAYMIGYDVCLAPGQWEDPTAHKYIVTHEIGHSVQKKIIQYAISNDQYTAGDASSSQTRCLCTHVSTGEPSHCLGSRETIEAANKEGFAHFFATMVFNNRTEDNGMYVYPKEAYDWTGSSWTVKTPPVAWKAYRGANERTTDRWMEKNCNPGAEDMGVESDWLRFNYELWTTGADKYNADEILSVHDRAYNEYGGWYWDYQEASARDLYDDDKEDLYIDKGEQLGVDHHSDPQSRQ